MASDFNHLNAAQKAWAEKIVSYGMQHGYSPDVTQAALMLAHQESDLGKFRHNLAGSSASGLFQFMGPEHIQDERIGYRTNHPETAYAKKSTAEIFKSDNATMAVMFDQVERWKQEFTVGFLPDSASKKLQAHGMEETVKRDFNLYAYFRHNTDPEQAKERFNAAHGIAASTADINAYVDHAYHHTLSTNRAMHKVHATQDLHILHAGPGHVELPNGFPVTLTGKNDYVAGVGSSYVIHQGKNEKFVDVHADRIIESRSRAFRDTASGNQNNSAAAGKLVVMPNQDLVVNPVHHQYAPYVLPAADRTDHSGYANADGSGTSPKPPLMTVGKQQHDHLFNQLLMEVNACHAHKVPVKEETHSVQMTTIPHEQATELQARLCAVDKSLSGCPAQNAAVMKLVHERFLLAEREPQQHV